jgi:hypothetical protein
VMSVMIYLHVRKIETQSMKYIYRASSPDASSWMGPASEPHSMTLATADEPLEHSRGQAESTSATLHVEGEESMSNPNDSPAGTTLEPARAPSSVVGFRDEISESAGKQASRFESANENRLSTGAVFSSPRAGSVHPPRKSMRASIVGRFARSSQAEDGEAAFRKHTREVANQCFWYAGAFYFCWTALSVSVLFHAQLS